MLEHRVLEGLADEQVIAPHLIGKTPVSDLVLMHNRIAAIDDRIPKVHEKTTGHELKEAIRKHEPEIIIDLLYNYIKAKKASMMQLSVTVDGRASDGPDSAGRMNRRSDPAQFPNPGRRASDRDPAVADAVVVANDKEKKKLSLTELAPAVTAMLMIGVVCLIAITVWSTAAGDKTSAESSKSVLKVIIEIIKFIFE